MLIMRLDHGATAITLSVHFCPRHKRLSITDAAAALGVSRNSLSELVNARRGISPEMAVRLSKAFGGSPASWLAQQMNYDIAQFAADKIKVKRLEVA